jgi:probable rRNA maturation factor
VETLAPDADSLAVRFVSDREMRRLNATFRGRDKATDVLTFPGDLRAPDAPEPSGEPPAGPLAGHLGDVAISVPTARRQARELGHGADRELRILLLHGLLHCLGYDHETDDGTMERLETRLRERLIDPAPRR